LKDFIENPDEYDTNEKRQNKYIIRTRTKRFFKDLKKIAKSDELIFDKNLLACEILTEIKDVIHIIAEKVDEQSSAEYIDVALNQIISKCLSKRVKK